jgi:uncharacterized membrane protein
MQPIYDMMGLLGAALIVGGLYLWSPAVAVAAAGLVFIAAAVLLTKAARMQR